MATALEIVIKGIVQGVGYRPFIYSLATELKIKGWVNNNSDGLYIHAEGDQLEAFYDRLEHEKPALANVMSIERKEVPFGNFSGFSIVKSKHSEKKDVLISPDVATCKDCVRELFDPNDRRYLYPFINCTNCGPRYSIIYDRPYDREKTTMGFFVMCDQCQEEYTNPLNRRFHAQPVACDRCGPKLKLLDNTGQEVFEYGIGVNLLGDGKILAVKGIGGYHLVCDATNTQSVDRLRSLKERGSKPFAIMARNIEKVKNVVWITEKEEEIIAGPAAPIVLLPKKKGENNNLIAQGVAPGLHTLGMMLPYTPIHHLLCQGKLDYLVMTSANLSGQPLIYGDEEALKGLSGIADYFLVHNREIFHPIDDSVVQSVDGQMTFIRRARGYVPFPILLTEEMSGSISALGGEMKNSFCLAAGNMAFMSQYIGDMHGYENLERFKQEFNTYQKAVNIYPEKVGYDLHPDYATTRIAREMALPKVTIQHHHAHHVSVMTEHGIDQPLLGLICDGTGYGDDNRIWGFEFIFGDKMGYTRKGHLEYLPLPGGDAGVKFPLRIAYAYVNRLLSEDEWKSTEAMWTRLPLAERSILDAQLRSGFHLYETSSAGRLFDAVSGLLDICTQVTYEGQAAVELESRAYNADGENIAHLAMESVNWTNSLVAQYKSETGISSQAHHRYEQLDIKPNYNDINGKEFVPALPIDSVTNQEMDDEGVKCLIDLYNVAVLNTSKTFKIIDSHSHTPETGLYPFPLKYDAGAVQIQTKYLFLGIINDIQQGRSIEDIALCFHFSLACAMVNTALIIGIKDRKLVMGGGVFHNKLLTEILLELVKLIEIELICPQKLPAGDGGLALGQVIIANHALRWK